MYDVIIVGGGIIGSSIAWQLSRQNARVLVIERNDTASGSAGATDGVVGYHTKKPGIQMELAKLSIDMFKTLHEELEEDIEYGLEAGGLQPVEDETQWEILSSIAEQQKASGVDIRMISAEEARRIEPNLAEDIYGALYSPTGGKVNPLKLTFAFAKAAKRNGAVFLYRTEVSDFIIEDHMVRGVKTAAGEEYFAEKAIVNACGAYAGKVAALAGLELPVNPRKGQLAVTEPIAPFMTATVQCARYNVIKFRPDLVTDKASLELGSSLSIEQTESGSIIIGGTRELVGFDTDNTFEAVDVMMRRAVRFFPKLKNVGIVRCFAGVRPYTPDGLPLLGEVKVLKNFYMAAGHEGDGIALAPITGKLIAELILKGKSSFDLTYFSPDRFLKTQ